MLIWREDFNLIIAWKATHEWKDDASNIFIDYLIDIGSGEIVFGTSPIQIPKIDANADSSLFFVHRNYIG